MNILGIVRLSLSRIWAAKVRSSLTMLGIIIGVGSLMGLTSIADGASRALDQATGALNAGNVSIDGLDMKSLNELDARRIAEHPEISEVGMRTKGQAVFQIGNKSATIEIVGITPNYIKLRPQKVAVGRFLSSNHGGVAPQEVTLSALAAIDLKVTKNDVGKSVRINGAPYRLVGVLDVTGASYHSSAAYLPIERARSFTVPAPAISGVDFTVANHGKVKQVQEELEQILRERRNLDQDDELPFTFTADAEAIRVNNASKQILYMLFVGIASIGLAVGGIGIMNIMLVAVRERTREIGVRRACGALRRHILVQFVVEALVISILGGFIGVLLGIAIAYGVSIGTGWEFVLSVHSTLLALGYSMGTGLFFGVWPAISASRLAPVEALRFE